TYHDDYVLGFRCKGVLLNHNTLESFKGCDKNAFLKNHAIQFYNNLMKETSLRSSSDLVNFLLLSFADLKTYKFYHWFAFPVPTELTYKYDEVCTITASSEEHLRTSIVQFMYQKPTPNEPFFLYHDQTGIQLLNEYIQHDNIEVNFHDKDMEKLYFCFYDPSGHESTPPGWHLRQLLTPVLAEQRIKIIRMTGATASELQLSQMTVYLPKHVPSANECSVWAWGVTHLTIVDCGQISLSNPIRQSLYRYQDALNGGKPKASTAAERLLEINPAAKITGINLKIPMPGHPVSKGKEDEETRDTLNKLVSLVEQHDVIYLLTDSRESRWLPTMLGAFHNKIIINAALGFDSYLVMRHGFNRSSESQRKDIASQTSPDIAGFRKINSCDLGCYFCNDIVSPGNSMKDRTLDQQCTVTRPGVSSMASADAPAYYRTPKTDPSGQEQEPEGLLGIIPHSIRGNIYTLQSMVTATERYTNCVACSSSILERYACSKEDFIINVLNGTESLEAIAGLNNMMSEMYDGDCIKVI
uniref:Ubiquitin-like modifier-activating enzyme ATG7 n=1 Tax=Anopheles epiroticus TaxID=199890 RepID=A0A182PVR7_9DIPT